MASGRSVVINGDLGSGKSTVSVLLARRLQLRRVSVGDLYRQMAAQRGMSALQFNLHAELDDEIDDYVDGLQRQIAASGERLVVDSRLAWHFFTSALKVHLITDAAVAASRVLARPTSVETYTSIEEARGQLASRSESERLRFQTRYGVDKTRLRNYDLVCDTTRASPAEIVERIVESLGAPRIGVPGPVCHLDPRRIFPATEVPTTEAPTTEAPTSEILTTDVLSTDVLSPDDPHYPPDPPCPHRLVVGYVAPHFFAVQGHRHLSRAVAAGRTLVEATLVADAADQIAPINGAAGTTQAAPAV